MTDPKSEQSERERAVAEDIHSAEMEGLKVSEAAVSDSASYVAGEIDSAEPELATTSTDLDARPPKSTLKESRPLLLRAARSTCRNSRSSQSAQHYYIHPFREGNDRTQRSFRDRVSKEAG